MKNSTLDELSELHNQIISEIESGVSLKQAYFVMNIMATIFACYGLLVNNVVVLIGSMLVASLLGPIVGSAFALITGNKFLLLRAILSIVGGVTVVYTTALIIAFIYQDLPITDEIMKRTMPNFLDFYIAFIGGAAAVYAQIFPGLSMSLVGVGIVVSLVPPLASSAILLVHGKYALAGGALSLAFINVVGIQLATTITFTFLKYIKKHQLFNK